MRIRADLIDGTRLEGTSMTPTSAELDALSALLNAVIEDRSFGRLTLDLSTGERCWIPSSQIRAAYLVPDPGEGLEPIDVINGN
jgi:hypothetical protein